jgi:hypothetical protein
MPFFNATKIEANLCDFSVSGMTCLTGVASLPP